MDLQAFRLLKVSQYTGACWLTVLSNRLQDRPNRLAIRSYGSVEGVPRFLRSAPMMRRILANAVVALAVMATAACSSKSEQSAPAASPEANEPAPTLDLSEAEVVPGSIVVDFKDGTTKEQFDAWEAEWGVDLEFNSVEGQDDGLTVAVGVDDV